MDHLRLRRLVADDPHDATDWARLLAEAEAVDRTGHHRSAADLREELGQPDLHVEGVEEDGRLVAVSTVLPRGESEGAFRILTTGVVAPGHRGRGIGTRLTGAALERATTLARRLGPDLPPLVNGWARLGDRAADGVLTSYGMEPVRRTHAMRVALPTGRPPVPVPDGYRLTPYGDELAEPLRLAHNAAFTGHHPGFTPWDRESWRRTVVDSRAFRGDVSAVALHGGAVVGYVVVLELDGHTAATGRREAHLSRVGTAPGHRGRGLAAALLDRTLRRCAEAGYEEAGLHVDAENPTGALGVYRRSGFEVESTGVTYALRPG